MSLNHAAEKRLRRALALSLGLFLLFVYLFIYRGGFHSIDEVSMFAVTESLAKFARVNTNQIAWTQWTTTQAEAQGFFGRGGNVYSKKGLALSLAQAPLYWLALKLPGIGMLQTVSVLNGVVTAATGLLLFMFIWRLGYSPVTAVKTALVYGLATIAFVYAKYLFSEPLAGFFLLLAAYMLFTYRQEGGLRHIAIAGLAAGLAVLTRANNLFLLPVFGLYLLWIIATAPNNVSAAKLQSLRAYPAPLITFGLALAVPGLMLMGYNALRAGNPLQTGYDLTLFSPNILLGLYKLLFSPLRGLFIYSPILLLSLPGWWRFRKAFPAEAWLFAGLAGVTIGLFSAWSSGEGLSWGSRFLVPVVPFFVLALAPLLQPQAGARPNRAFRMAGYGLLVLSLGIQFLGVAINPWVFLAKLQAGFGGEFFLENTAALYNFRYSQIAGQLQTWSVSSSDLAWWQPWGFDGPAFGLSLAGVAASGWLLWRFLAGARRRHLPAGISTRLAAAAVLAVAVAYLLLARYYTTDRQFGPPNDNYTRALQTAVTRAAGAPQLVTVAQYHYHVPMNRFKAAVPLTGFARQTWPPPETALPLLNNTLPAAEVWLITVGFPPAAPDNATERWLAFNAYKATDEWLGDVRLLRYGSRPPNISHPVGAQLGRDVKLQTVKFANPVQPGHLLPVEFIWTPVGRPKTNYNLFLQLLGPNAAAVAQHDSPPNGGYTATSTWQPGQTITDRHALALPASLPPGEYRLIAGLYNPNTGTRLPVDGAGDFVELGAITVNAQPLPR